MTKEQIVEELRLVNYNDLEKEFKKRGIPQAWERGRKKEDIISDAADLLIAGEALELAEAPIRSSITREDLLVVLNGTEYHKLRDVFETHGIVGTLRGGQKKEELIQSALRRFNEIVILLDDGDNPIKTKEELIARVEKDDLARIANEEERKKQSEINQKAIDKRAKDEALDRNLSKEQVLGILANIGKNLANNIPTQRAILLKKQALYQDLLDSGKCK